MNSAISRGSSRRDRRDRFHCPAGEGGKEKKKKKKNADNNSWKMAEGSLLRSYPLVRSARIPIRRGNYVFREREISRVNDISGFLSLQREIILRFEKKIDGLERRWSRRRPKFSKDFQSDGDPMVFKLLTILELAESFQSLEIWKVMINWRLIKLATEEGKKVISSFFFEEKLWQRNLFFP